MAKARQFIAAAARWSWFVLLVLLAFGYLAAGLSKSDPTISSQSSGTATDLESAPHSVDAELADRLQVVDNHWRESIDAQGLESAEAADWLTICRRMSLALVGNQLSLEEIRALEKLPQRNREAQHLANLLDDPRYHHYWAERWTRFLVGTDEGEFIIYRRRRFRIWLSEVFAANRPYDEMVRDLVTATGLWTDKPEVNFLTATFDSSEDGNADPIRMAARTARVFLGLRIDCLQCHDDMLGHVNLGHVDDPRGGMQTDFHQLAAFYTSAKTSGLRGVYTDKVDYKYKYLDADEETPVEAAVPYSPELLPAEGDPRERLATWITHPENRQAARAAVSHVWALMLGRPIGDAVDSLPLETPLGPMFDAIVDDFVEHDFDMRRLIRLIASSAAFRVDSRASFDVTEEHEQHHAVFPLVRLRPEQVAGCVIQASRIKKTDRESSIVLQLQTYIGTNDFVTQYGDLGEDEFTTDNVTVSQRLLMMNGEMLRGAIESNPILNATAHVGMFASSDERAVEVLYLCVLNRYPTPEEETHFVGRIAEAENREDGLEDLVWVLLNSSELAWNH